MKEVIAVIEKDVRERKEESVQVTVNTSKALTVG